MMAKVVRDKVSRRIESFGPNHDGFAPSYDAAQQELTIENYDAVLAEWSTYPKPIPPRQAAKEAIQAYLDGTMTARDAMASIKDAL